MSPDVSPGLLEQARHGEVSEAAFVATVRTSLPYAYDLISSLAAGLSRDDVPFSDNQVPPPGEAERGQLLRALASDSIRAAWSVTSASGSPSRTATGSPRSGPRTTGRPTRNSSPPGPSCSTSHPPCAAADQLAGSPGRAHWAGWPKMGAWPAD